MPAKGGKGMGRGGYTKPKGRVKPGSPKDRRLRENKSKKSA